MTVMPQPPALKQNQRAIAGQYKLAAGPMAGNYGLDVAIGEPQIDESRMAIKIPYANGERRDGVGDLLDVGGIQLWRHRANPICLFDHGKVQGNSGTTLPIGTCEDPDTKAYRNEIDVLAKTAAAWNFFYSGTGLNGVPVAEEYSHALFCEQLFDMTVKRILRGGSIGYQNIKTLPLQADYQTGTPAGQHLLVTLMLEFSLVVLPANGDTVMKSFPSVDAYNEWEESVRRNLSRGYLVCGKALSPVLHKSLATYVPEETKASTGGGLVTLKQIDEAAERKMKEVAVPLANLPDTKIPPAQFDPGVGATCKKVKELRSKYARKSYDQRVDQLKPRDIIQREDGQWDIVRKVDVGPDFVRLQLESGNVWMARPHNFVVVKHLKSQPSAGISPEKARQILKDGEVRGHPLTEKQRGLFGAAAGRGKQLRRKYMGVDQQQVATDTCACGSDGACACRKQLPMKLTSDWKAISRKSIGHKYYEARRVRRDRDGLEGWIVWNTTTNKPANDEIYLNEQAARNYAQSCNIDDPGSGDDPNAFRRGRKSIQVKYRNKLVRGVPNVSMKFDTSGMTTAQQQAFCKDMAEAGFGKAKGHGGRWSDGEKTQLTAPMKAATFAFDMDPATANIPDAVGKAVTIAAKHGAKFLGSQKSTQVQGIKAMPQANTKAVPTKKKAMPGSDVEAMPDAAQDAVAVATDELAGVEGDVLAAEEKMGAQVLRRLHEIHSALLEEGDEMAELLENPNVKKLLENKLKDVVSTLEEVEAMFGKEGYGSLSEKDMDSDGAEATGEEEPTDSDGELEEALPDDSDVVEEEPAEDAVQGMNAKQLQAKVNKLLRKQYKAAPPVQTKSEAADERNEMESEDSPTAMEQEKSLDQYERNAVGKAAAFLKSIGESTESWGEMHRMESYHHHKTLEPIGAIEQGVGEGNVQMGGAQPKNIEIDGTRATRLEADTEEQDSDLEHGKDITTGMPDSGMVSDQSQIDHDLHKPGVQLTGRKAIGQASCFLKELSTAQEFNDDFRTKSLGWHKQLSPLAQEQAQGVTPDDMHAEGIAAMPDGGVETKKQSMIDAKALKEAALQDKAASEAINRKFDQLLKIFGG
jgi:hypothetical protein